jgi:threonine synthase
LIDRVPRLLCVQAAGAAPFYRSFTKDFAERSATRAETVATAIRIGDPASYDRGVRAVRFTRGVVVSVPDDAILSAQHQIGSGGVGCEPASAASVAGVRSAIESGLIKPDESVVAVLTGHLLKDPGAVANPNGKGANIPIEIEPTIDAIERELR